MNIFTALILKWVVIIGVTKGLKKAVERAEKKRDSEGPLL